MPPAMRLVRWTLTRLEGLGALDDLPGFLGCTGLADRNWGRAVCVGRMSRMRGRVLDTTGGGGGRRVWTLGGPPEARLADHLAALREGARAARAELTRVTAWAVRARAATAMIRGPNPGRVIAVLAARPLASAENVARAAGISRMTAERMLNRLTHMGIAQEITGAARFRLWRAELAAACRGIGADARSGVGPMLPHGPGTFRAWISPLTDRPEA